MRKEDEEEDYLDDSKPSSSGAFGSCSVILTMLCSSPPLPQRHRESYEMRLPLCVKDGRLPAAFGNHHFPARDVSLLAATTDGTPCGR